ncbi:MAG: hypothetical protein ACPGAP_03910, partial [Akkermansiaceae bacterium]
MPFRVPHPAILLSLFVSIIPASGVEWDQIFTPQKGWSKASKVEANDKNLIVKADGEATFF